MASGKYSEKCDDLLTFYPFTKHDGIFFLNNPPIVANPAKRLEAVSNFDSWESDVILASPMKTGTHWVQEILSMLLTQQTEQYDSAGLIMDRNFEALLDLENAGDIPKPRLFLTHNQPKYLPRKHLENGYKIVYLNRNPKDRYVSLYHFVTGKTGVPNWTWADFFERFVVGNEDVFGGWFSLTKNWEDLAKTNPDSVYPIKYEELKKDPFTTVTKLAKFLGLSCTPEFIRTVVEKCSFDNLKENKADASRCIEPSGKSTLFRKGEVGDWKNWFTVAQNEQYEQLYKKEMEGYDLGNYVSVSK